MSGRSKVKKRCRNCSAEFTAIGIKARQCPKCKEKEALVDVGRESTDEELKKTCLRCKGVVPASGPGMQPGQCPFCNGPDALRDDKQTSTTKRCDDCKKHVENMVAGTNLCPECHQRTLQSHLLEGASGEQPKKWCLHCKACVPASEPGKRPGQCPLCNEYDALREEKQTDTTKWCDHCKKDVKIMAAETNLCPECRQRTLQSHLFEGAPNQPVNSGVSSCIEYLAAIINIMFSTASI